jgi:phosphoribosylaminoimidazole (AIR) synthetase
VKSILDALSIKDSDGTPAIHGMAHITGGGLWENVPRILPEDTTAVIDCASWELPPVFQWLKEAGNLKPMDLATTLNTGIGMAVICSEDQKAALTERFESNGESVFEIGKIQKRNASDENIIFENIDDAWG